MFYGEFAISFSLLMAFFIIEFMYQMCLQSSQYRNVRINCDVTQIFTNARTLIFQMLQMILAL